MDIYTTKPVKELSREEFSELLKGKNVKASPHAFFHLSIKQRKVFNEDELINMVNKENSRKTYLQENGRYVAYYRRKDGYRKVIVELEGEKATIVSFMDTPELPRIEL